jgi:hypothetical protein
MLSTGCGAKSLLSRGSVTPIFAFLDAVGIGDRGCIIETRLAKATSLAFRAGHGENAAMLRIKSRQEQARAS